MNSNPNRSFSQFLKQRIKYLGKSQRSLAEALDVSPAYVSQIFSGKKKPPDLGRPRNRKLAKIWADFLEIDYEELIALVRHELHKAPLPPTPRYPGIRDLCLKTIQESQSYLTNEIRAMVFHPAEQSLLQFLTQIYMLNNSCHHTNRVMIFATFEDIVRKSCSNKHFVENELAVFFKSIDFTWTWDEDFGRVDVEFYSPELIRSANTVKEFIEDSESPLRSMGAPVLGHISSGEGFDYAEHEQSSDQQSEIAPLPPGMNPGMASLIYCLKGKALIFNDILTNSAFIYVKRNSWNELSDGDLVIYKDPKLRKGFFKRMENNEEAIILRPLNPTYKNVILKRSDVSLLEKVVAVVF